MCLSSVLPRNLVPIWLQCAYNVNQCMDAGLLMDEQSTDSIVPEMRERLLANRSGKLTPSQWLDVVLQPLTPILLLVLPAGLLLLPRLIFTLARGGWVMIVLVILFIVGSFLWRARQYARRPLHHAQMTARASTPPVWMFWRSLVLATDDGTILHFGKRLAPRPRIERGKRYTVYYLREVDDNVLLSIAPIDHPRAKDWQPDQSFKARFDQRKSNDPKVISSATDD